MRLTSTTGRAPEVGLRRAVREGLAPDGGLYLPTALPDLTGADLASCGVAGAAFGGALCVGAILGQKVMWDLLSLSLRRRQVK